MSKKLPGEKVYLRPITMADTGLVVQWRNQEAVRSRFIFRQPFTAQIHEKWMEEKVNTGKVAQFIIVENSTDRSVGSVYLRDIDKENRSAEFGIFIGEDDARGRGYGTEAARLITRYGFDELALHRIFLRVLVSNQRAIRSYDRCGFETEGIARDMLLLDGKYESIQFMSMLAE